MALQCQMSLNYAAYSAGQTPAPMATLQVYNPNASAVVVTGVQLVARVLNGSTVNQLAMNPSVVPIGPGQTTSVPALSSINIGPFPIAVASAANVNSFQAINSSGIINPVNPQGTQPPQFTVLVGAEVYGSDGSLNVAGVASLVVSYQSPPPPGFQGGVLQFNAPNNALGLFPGWP